MVIPLFLWQADNSKESVAVSDKVKIPFWKWIVQWIVRGCWIWRHYSIRLYFVHKCPMHFCHSNPNNAINDLSQDIYRNNNNILNTLIFKCITVVEKRAKMVAQNKLISSSSCVCCCLTLACIFMAMDCLHKNMFSVNRSQHAHHRPSLKKA